MTKYLAFTKGYRTKPSVKSTALQKYIDLYGKVTAQSLPK